MTPCDAYTKQPKCHYAAAIDMYATTSANWQQEYSMFHHMGCQIFDSPFTVLRVVWKYVFPHFLDYV